MNCGLRVCHLAQVILSPCLEFAHGCFHSRSVDFCHGSGFRRRRHRSTRICSLARSSRLVLLIRIRCQLGRESRTCSACVWATERTEGMRATDARCGSSKLCSSSRNGPRTRTWRGNLSRSLVIALSRYYARTARGACESGSRTMPTRRRGIPVREGAALAETLDEDAHSAKRDAVGRLNWLARRSRPDLSLQVWACARRLSSLTWWDVRMVNKAIRAAKYQRNAEIQINQMRGDIRALGLSRRELQQVSG